MVDSSARVIVLYGNDEFAIAKRMKSFQAALGDSPTVEMNVARLDGQSMTEDELNTAVNSLPFLAAQRLVLLTSPSTRYNNPDTRKKFIEFLEKVPGTARVVIHEHVDNRKKDENGHWLLRWALQAGGQARVERYMMPQAWEMTGWIQTETKNQGGKIEPRGAARLAEMVGENTRQAAQEITKLLTYINYERPISEGDVEQVSVVTAQGDIFSLVDALGLGKGKDAQAMLHRLLDEQDPFSIFGMIVRQFRLLLLACEVIDSGGNIHEIQEALRVQEFVAKKVYAQAKHFSQEALEAIYHRLLVIDEGAKTSQVPLDLALDMLVVELTK